MRTLHFSSNELVFESSLSHSEEKAERIVLSFVLKKRRKFNHATTDPLPLIHWGVTLLQQPEVWQTPNPNLPALKYFTWPVETTHVPGAAQTKLLLLEGTSDSQWESFGTSFVLEGLSVCGPSGSYPRSIEFVLKINETSWIKAGSRNFSVSIGEFVQLTCRDRLLRQSIEGLVGSRLTTCPSHLRKQAEWVIGSNQGSLVCLAFCDQPDSASFVFVTDVPRPLLLHWSLSESLSAPWKAPDARLVLKRPPVSFVSHPFDKTAMQTEFAFVSQQGEVPVQHLELTLHAAALLNRNVLKFVLKERRANVWIKDQGKDFIVELPVNPEHGPRQLEYQREAETRQQREAEELAAKEAAWERSLQLFRAESQTRRAEEGSITYKHYRLSDNAGEIDFSASFDEETGTIDVLVTACCKVSVVLHWGTLVAAGERLKSTAADWQCPEESMRPPGTVVVDPARSCETPLIQNENEPFIQNVIIKVPAKREPPHSQADLGIKPAVVSGIALVLRQIDGPRWIKTEDQTDITVRLTSTSFKKWQGPAADLAEKIIEAETGWDHMTLMHRFNLVNGELSRWEKECSSAPLSKGYSWFDIFKSNDQLGRGDVEIPGEYRDFPQEGLTSLKDDEEFWSWIYVWCRFSALRYLDWQRNYNTKPRELAHSTECLTSKLSSLWIGHPRYRSMIRLVLGTIPRGGSQGQAIRDRILEIMHRHRIPEHSANFYEQWHQKLHNNTTPDDVCICRAIIQYLKSGGNVSVFWDTLNAEGIGRSRLLSYERKIVGEPYMVNCDIGSLIRDFEQYLDILIDVHDSLDLKKAFDYARPHLAHDVIDLVGSVIHFHQSGDVNALHWHFMRTNQAREKLVGALLTSKNAESTRQLLFLDLALEQQQMLLLQSGVASRFSMPQLQQQIKALLVLLSGHDESDLQLNALARDWYHLSDACCQDGKGAESALLLKALTDRVSLLMGDMISTNYSWFDEKALFLGQAVGTDQQAIAVFVESTLRGSALFGVSLCLKRLEPLLRRAAKLPPWQLISFLPKVRGRLEKVDQFRNIQQRVFDIPTILLTGTVSGEEEIPAGVLAVLVRSGAECPDILSHVCVRARNAHVFFAVCFDERVAAGLSKLDNQWIEVSATESGEVSVTAMAEAPSEALFKRRESRHVLSAFDRRKASGMLDELVDSLKRTESAEDQFDFKTESEKWAITPDEFNSSNVGGKALNLSKLRKPPQALSSLVLPEAVSLPYGVFQKILNANQNKESVLVRLKECLEPLKSSFLPNSEVEKILRAAHDLIMSDEFKCPKELFIELKKAMKCQSSLVKLLESNGEAFAWNAIREVYASMFHLRPFISLSKAHRKYTDLNMAVLVQEMLNAQYAFVLHSQNPFNTQLKQMYGEIVCGLGEVLVGNFKGRALAWTLDRPTLRSTNSTHPKVVSFPSKLVGLKAPKSLIFRSDSNGEDLEGFAGAGLFESIPSVKPKAFPVHYSLAKIVTDRDYRENLLTQIGQLAFSIEEVFGYPVDIEGCVIGDELTGRECLGVVQTRPQIL